MKYIQLLPLVILLASCNESGTNPSDKTLKVYENAAVSNDYPHVTSGENWVFHYYYLAPDEEEIADDEFSEDFLIEVVPSGNAFEYSSESLALVDIPVVYKQYCFCGPINRTTLTEFDFSGTRNGNNWSITGTVTLTLASVDETSGEVYHSFEKELDISGTYILSTL